MRRRPVRCRWAATVVAAAVALGVPAAGIDATPTGAADAAMADPDFGVVPPLRPFDGFLRPGSDGYLHPFEEPAPEVDGAVTAPPCQWFVWDDQRQLTRVLDGGLDRAVATLREISAAIDPGDGTEAVVTVQEQCPESSPLQVRTPTTYRAERDRGARVHRLAWSPRRQAGFATLPGDDRGEVSGWWSSPDRVAGAFAGLPGAVRLPRPVLRVRPDPTVRVGTVTLRAPLLVGEPVTVAVVPPTVESGSTGAVDYRAEPLLVGLDAKDYREHADRGLPTDDEPRRRYADPTLESCRIPGASLRRSPGQELFWNHHELAAGSTDCSTTTAGELGPLQFRFDDNSANSDLGGVGDELPFGYAYRSAFTPTTTFGPHNRCAWQGRPEWRFAVGILWRVTSWPTALPGATRERLVWSVTERAALVNATSTLLVPKSGIPPPPGGPRCS